MGETKAVDDKVLHNLLLRNLQYPGPTFEKFP